MYPAAPEETVAGPDESAGSAATLKLCPHEEFLKLCKERAGEVLCSVHETEEDKQLLSLITQYLKAVINEQQGGDSGNFVYKYFE